MELYFDFKYPLDDFQKEGILHINNNENILVTAHTGAGKTTLALHAISRCYHNNQSVIYTSPIKTLSNQKFNEFNQIFDNVGILTGDVKINPTGSLLIMTAEILNNALRSNNIQSISNNNIQSNNIQSNNIQSIYDFNFDIDKVKCVILDEVHYINDKDRGKVWEEIILKLPSNVQLVMLSATLNGAEKMAKWITDLKNVKCNWITTSYRPVPLRHYFYIPDDNKKILLLEGDNNWKSENYNYVYTNYLNNKKYRPKSDFHQINQLVEHLKINNGLPATLFMLNRNMVEKIGLNITLQLSDNYEVSEINKIWDSKFKSKYEAIYSTSSQWTLIKTLLMKGIGIHHSGLIPLLKDIVEILYEKKLIKLLIATETFAMGVNMPTKTTIFTDLVKYDGTGKRNLYSNEYIQMAGRAGRRGMDTFGEVIILPLFKDTITEYEMKNIMLPNPIKLVSKFDFNYSFILKNHKNNIINKEDILNIVSNTLMDVSIQKEYKSLLEEFEENMHSNNMHSNNMHSNNMHSNNMQSNNYDIYKNIMELKDKLNGYIKPSPKYKKEILKQIAILNDKINMDNVELYKDRYDKELKLLKIKDGIDLLGNMYSNQYDTLIKFLESENIIINNINNNSLTKKGEIVAIINDCSPLVLLNVIEILDDLSFEEIVGVLSLIVDDTNTEWYRLDTLLKTEIEKEMSKEYLDLVCNLERSIFNVFKLEDKLNNKLVIKNNNENVYGYNNFYQSYLWAKGCKYSIIKPYNNYDGNFIKNILRIVNIIRNLVNIYISLSNTNVLNKLYNFEEKLIRDVVTVDSLYL
jgi:superfamily II RNA helicase